MKCWLYPTIMEADQQGSGCERSHVATSRLPPPPARPSPSARRQAHGVVDAVGVAGGAERLDRLLALLQRTALGQNVGYPAFY